MQLNKNLREEKAPSGDIKKHLNYLTEVRWEHSQDEDGANKVPAVHVKT